mmetsp:Transcript_14495/g.29004  ORF Transcript_14495/g.29004 Transcript_14495/m.29004 type:complete len:233 (-) Transcript_14495:398-1096(-)
MADGMMLDTTTLAAAGGMPVERMALTTGGMSLSILMLLSPVNDSSFLVLWDGLLLLLSWNFRRESKSFFLGSNDTSPLSRLFASLKRASIMASLSPPSRYLSATTLAAVLDSPSFSCHCRNESAKLPFSKSSNTFPQIILVHRCGRSSSETPRLFSRACSCSLVKRVRISCGVEALDRIASPREVNTARVGVDAVVPSSLALTLSELAESSRVSLTAGPSSPPVAASSPSSH